MISQKRYSMFADKEKDVIASEIPDSGFASPDSDSSCKMNRNSENHRNSYANSRWRQGCLKNGTQSTNEGNKEFDAVTMKTGAKEVIMALKYILFYCFNVKTPEQDVYNPKHTKSVLFTTRQAY